MSQRSDIPTAFIAYSWDDELHKLWVYGLAARLRSDGVAITLDQWELALGDQITEFMETAVRESDYVIIVCTPTYKERSDNRVGGVGYEGHIITSEVYGRGDHRKFIPILRSGNWREAAPSWLAGKKYADLSGSPYSEESYQELLQTLLGNREKAPPLDPSGSDSATQGVSESLRTFRNSAFRRWQELVRNEPYTSAARFRDGSYEMCFSLVGAVPADSLRSLKFTYGNRKKG